MALRIEIDGYSPPSQMRIIAAALLALAELEDAQHSIKDNCLPEVAEKDPEPISRMAAVVDKMLPAAEVAAEPTAAQAFAPAVAPVPPPPAPEARPNGIDVDANGLPWDGRIHSSSRAVVADGQWRVKRGVPPELVTSVTAELRATMGLPSIPVQAVPVPPPFVASAEVLPAPVTITPPPPAAILPSDGAAAPASPSSLSFPQLMQAITKKFAAKELDQATISAAVASAGLSSLPMLNARPDLIPTVAAALGIA